MVYDTYNYSIHGVYQPTYNWGAPHCIIHVELGSIPFLAGVSMSENIPIADFFLVALNYPSKAFLLDKLVTWKRI